MNNPKKILEQVANEFGISVKELKSKRRFSLFIRARKEVTRRMLMEGMTVADVARTLDCYYTAAKNYAINKKML